MSATEPNNDVSSRLRVVAEVLLLVGLFFIYAGDMPPMVNEAHYLVKAKNFWQPDWCANDLFAASGKAHTVFYVTFGWLTRILSLEAAAWIGRFAGWKRAASQNIEYLVTIHFDTSLSVVCCLVIMTDIFSNPQRTRFFALLRLQSIVVAIS